MESLKKNLNVGCVWEISDYKGDKKVMNFEDIFVCKTFVNLRVTA